MASLSTSKLLALLALFFLQVHASPVNSPRSLPAREPFICPVEDIESTQCKGPKDCLYPNPDSCTSYIQCEVNADGVTGTPIIRPCVAELLVFPLQWNDNFKECGLAEFSTCPHRG
ncbi:hypothetical protein GGX14DRAFT_578707 [Mycena pura]|uniref:Chitin-binding type-2 domain-containing protein n=1 Tax=Mycena pura TaxID=153505 RepID=A0AAD6UW66_9AGAR|nr:hypothetical protein GGX14DRAFT_578707 [Mycena pura]